MKQLAERFLIILPKPVNPSQVLLVCKKILEGKKISGQYAAKDYLQDFNQITQALFIALILLNGLIFIKN